jgi:hypothetical protein
MQGHFYLNPRPAKGNSWLAWQATHYISMHGPPTWPPRPAPRGATPETIHVERKIGETRLNQLAPGSNDRILSYIAGHLPGLPRSD